MIAAITGASRGIGKACAIGLAQNGYDIALVGRNLDTLQAAASEIMAIGRKTHLIPTDAADFETLSAALSNLPRLDVLVNNVGTNIPEPFVQVSQAHFDQIFLLNVKTAFFAAQAASKKMLAQKAA